MCKRIPFPFIQQMGKCAPSIPASSLFTSRQSTSKPVHNENQKNPNNIYKMPIKNPKIHPDTMAVLCTRHHQKANKKIQKSYNHVKTVKTSSEIKTTSKNRITESKSSSCIFQILTINKQKTLRDCYHQVETTGIFLILFQPMFPPIGCKIGSKQQQCVHFRQSPPLDRHNTQGRPTHPQLNSRLKGPMKERPKQSNKKHPFRPNKQIHSQLKTALDFSSVKSRPSFTKNITPPQKSAITQAKKGNQNKTSPSTILMKIQHRRKQNPHQSKSSQPRPRTRIYLVIPVMRPPGSVCRKRTLMFLLKIKMFFLKNRCHLKKKESTSDRG